MPRRCLFFLLGLLVLSLCATNLGAAEGKKKKRAAERGFLHLVPEGAAAVVASPGLGRLQNKARRLEKEFSEAFEGLAETIGMGVALALQKSEAPRGIDPARPIGAAVTLAGEWFFFLPAEDPKALRDSLGVTPVGYEADGYLVVAPWHRYTPPEPGRYRLPMAADLVLSVRPSAFVRQHRHIVDEGIAEVERELGREEGMAGLVAILDAEIALVRGILESLEQLDSSVLLRGDTLELAFRALPTKEGLTRRILDASAAGSAPGAGGLGRLLPPGAPMELELNLPPAALSALLDAIPWDKLGGAESAAKLAKAYKKMVDEMLGFVDGRMALSYSISDFKKLSFEINEVIGVKDGPAFRRYMKTFPERQELKDMLEAMKPFLPGFSLEVESDAFEVDGIPVDRVTEELEFPEMPGTPGFAFPGGKMRVEGYMAVVGDVAVVSLGENAKKTVEEMIRKKKAGGSYENLLSAAEPTTGFVRGVLDVVGLIRMLAKAAPEGAAIPVERLPRDEKLAITFTKSLQGDAAVARVRVPFVQLIKLFLKMQERGGKETEEPKETEEKGETQEKGKPDGNVREVDFEVPEPELRPIR
jgi:hypothetical protein